MYDKALEVAKEQRERMLRRTGNVFLAEAEFQHWYAIGLDMTVGLVGKINENGDAE